MYLLKEISENKCIFKYNNHANLEEPFIGAVGSISAANSLKKLIKKSKINDEARKHELEKIEESLRIIQHKTPIIVCLQQIKVLTNEKTDYTDIDGIGFGYRNGKLYLLLVEAKKQKASSYSDSRKRLIKNIKNKLKIKTSKISSLEEYIVELDKGACCYLPIDGEFKV